MRTISDSTINNEYPNTSSAIKDAAYLAFDVTRQFLTIAIGGIGFTLGLAYANPAINSSLLFNASLIVYALSVASGLLFLMHSVGKLSSDRSYNIYSRGLRVLSAMQILLVVLGTILLYCILRNPPESPVRPANGVIVIQTGVNSMTYPHESGKNYSIEFNGGDILFRTGD
jgi:hypothetical protein